MVKKITYILFLICSCLFSQNKSIPNYNNFYTLGISLGNTPSTNPGFPETKLYKSLLFAIGNTNLDNKDEWAYRLRNPNTGISLEFSDFGNPEYLGYSLSALSFIEYGLFKKHTQRLTMQLGIGASYFSYTYKNLPYSFNNYPENNSRGVSTKLTWAFKLLFNYNFIMNKKASWKAGVGFFHQSNGHTNLPNNGYNTVLLSVSRQAFYKKLEPIKNEDKFNKNEFKKTSQFFLDMRMGIGVNVLSETINERNGVYTLAPTFGKIINKTFKIGIGFFYRYYKNYYNYIINEGELVVEDNPHFMRYPNKYASNYGVFINSEFLLGHLSIEATIGYNIFKPFYETDWRLTEGFYWNFHYEDGTTEIKYVYGEKGKYPKGKQAITTRLGLRYYLFSNEKAPKNNFYIGANINANLSQADFSELSFGYVHSFGFNTK